MVKKHSDVTDHFIEFDAMDFVEQIPQNMGKDFIFTPPPVYYCSASGFHRLADSIWHACKPALPVDSRMHAYKLKRDVKSALWNKRLYYAKIKE